MSKSSVIKCFLKVLAEKHNYASCPGHWLNMQLTVVKTKINALYFSIITLNSQKIHVLTKTIQKSKCSYGVRHLLFAKSFWFCFSKYCIQIDTVNMLVKNINRLLIFLHSPFRHNSRLRKSKVKMQKIISLVLGKKTVLLVFLIVSVKKTFF